MIIGGGPAGLTAAYQLTKLGHRPVVLEKGGLLGGIARTDTYKGFHFDMGGHRFFTKAEEVDKLWREVLKDDFLRRPRLSRIYYKKKFFQYPLKALDALMGDPATAYAFRVTDGARVVPVVYRGIAPDTFTDGVDVVVEGRTQVA